MLHTSSYQILKLILLRTAIVAQALAPIVFPSVVAAFPTQTNTISIAAARQLPLGTIVKVEGSVTVPSGALKSSLTDEGFAIQDGSGGIYISMGANLGLRVRRRVRVTGKLAENNGMLMIVPPETSSVEASGRSSQLRPEAVTTGKVGETTEGRLVKVTGTITRPVGDDSPYGFRVFLDDGTGETQVFVSASTRINLRGLRAGMRISATGLSGQYKDHYEINPRFPADIRPAP